MFLQLLLAERYVLRGYDTRHTYTLSRKCAIKRAHRGVGLQCSVEDVGISRPGVHMKAEKFFFRPKSAPEVFSAVSFVDGGREVKVNTSARLIAADDDPITG